MKGEKSIQVIFDSKVMVFSISEKTTCEDVIKMATMRNNSPDNSKSKDFAIFESAFGISKMLSGQTKLLKQVRSWGSDEQKFSFEMRETDKVKSKMTSITRAKTKLKRIRALLKKHELKPDQKFETYLHDNFASNAKSKNFYNKNISCMNENSKIQNTRVGAEGKKELIQRYLNDSVKNNVTTLTDCFDIYLPERACVVGCEDNTVMESEVPERTCGVGCEDNILMDTELPERTCGDGEESFGYNTESDTQNDHDMNTAFVSSKTINIDAPFNSSDELNEAILYDNYVTFSDDDESAFEDDSDCYESVCELERYVIESYAENSYIKLNELKRIFSNDDLNARITDDDLLESFMNTFVHDEDSDEGRGSVYSDIE